MNGFSSERGISDVRFQNVVIAGKKVMSAEDARLQANEHVRGLQFAAE